VLFMTNERFDENIIDLKSAFGELSTTVAADGRRLLRVADADLPRGCKPSSTPVLLVLQNGARPVIYVKAGITLPNGAVPRSTSNVQVEGEPWLQFSFNFAWDENAHSLVQFVAASLRRFALTE
jgi:hypothetical protein